MQNVRDKFPIFERTIHGKPLVFLDSAASAQKPQVVIDAMDDVMKNHYANINRGVYTLSEEATHMVEAARNKIAQFIGASDKEIVFTRNATESINLVAYSWGRHFLKKGDIVVVTEMEHHANIIPWQILRDEIGIELVWMPVTNYGYLDFDNFKDECKKNNLESRIKLVSCTQVSNVLGTINPVKNITEWAHAIGARVLVDGAQAVTNVPVNVADIGCDWYVFSGHKLYGPSGVGVLYGKSEVLKEMPPFMTGGDMIREVRKERSSYKEAPWKFEAGTPAIVEIIGLGAAIDFIQGIGMDSIRKHMLALVDQTFSVFHSVEGIRVYGPTDYDRKGGVISFSMIGIHPHDIASILDTEGIAIRSGHHCAQPLCERFGQSALARISFGVYNTTDEIADKLFPALKKVRQTFA